MAVNVPMLKRQLQSGVDVNAKDNAGWSVLHESIRERPQTVDIVRMLVESGANVNIQADDGSTPLHDAASMKNEAIIKCLLVSAISFVVGFFSFSWCPPIR